MPPIIDTDKCTGCGVCVEDCPNEVLVMKDDRSSVSDADECVECGVCVDNCPEEAITLA
jgi:NAD-dependent dihydropyrimidine dehydrogenase PreA subunit